jgi:plastocyanin
MKVSVTFFLLLTIFLASCSPRIHLGDVYLCRPSEPIEIEMENFSFKPNHLAVLRNQSPIILHLKNTDGISHNFNLMAPDRNIILSQDLKPKESATVDIGFLNSENYVFYCFFHQYRGMEGMLMLD